jgi:hypothetical protein
MILQLDEVTRRSLELTRTLRDTGRDGSLLSVRDLRFAGLGRRVSGSPEISATSSRDFQGCGCVGFRAKHLLSRISHSSLISLRWRHGISSMALRLSRRRSGMPDAQSMNDLKNILAASGDHLRMFSISTTWMVLGHAGIWSGKSKSSYRGFESL